MMKFSKGKWVIALGVVENGHWWPKGFHRYAPTGVYQLRAKLCCDNFLLCDHKGKSMWSMKSVYFDGGRVASVQSSYSRNYTKREWFAVDNIFEAAFDTEQEAEFTRRLLI